MKNIFLKNKKAKVIFLLISVICLLLILTMDIFFNYLKLKGIQGSAFRTDPSGYIKAIPIELTKSIFNRVNLSKLEVSISSKQLEKIINFRNEAFKNKIISSNEKEYVKSNIFFNDNKFKAKVRLKGDWSDHLLGDKWSIRVKLQDNHHINGIRKFSLQNPLTRDFQGQFLINKMLNEFDIIAPRYSLVNASINGKNIGIMSILEHFSKELIESHRRKDSVIIKFDENDLWESRINKSTYRVDSQYGARITLFRKKKIKEDKQFSNYFNAAVGLMRGFLNGKLSADDVFDVELMGKFLAINDFWGESHGLIWHNLRYYYNPISTKLEPIGFDQMLYHNPVTLDNPIDTVVDGKYFSTIRSNGFIKLVYLNTLKELRANFSNKDYYKQYISLDNKYESILRPEFFLKPPPLMKNFNPIHKIDLLLKKFSSVIHVKSDNGCNWAVDPSDTSNIVYIYDNTGNVKYRADKRVNIFYKYGLDNLGLSDSYHGYCTSEREKKYKNDSKLDRLIVSNFGKLGDFQRFVNVFYFIKNNTNLEIEMQNISPYVLQAKGVKVIYEDETVELIGGADIAKNNILLPWISKQELSSKTIVLGRIDLSRRIDKVIVDFSILGQDNVHSTKAEKYVHVLSNKLILDSSVKNELLKHEFLKADIKNNTLEIEKGNWVVKEPIIVPSGYTLLVKEGVTLRFSPDSYILSHGLVRLVGSIEDPIVLTSHKPGKFWGGIAVYGVPGLNKNILSNIIIKNTSSIDKEHWFVDSGVFFYQSDVIIDNLKLINNNCEDALNIVNSKYNIHNIVVKNSAFDGIDIDFSTGEISNGSFSRIGYSGGGDALDFSGSNSNLSDLVIADISDKGISIGEESGIFAKNINISRSSIGIAVKDGSLLKINRLKIEDSEIFDISSYVKKNEYKGANIFLSDTDLFINKNKINSDIKSKIFINNILIQ
jgi:hypothetical protein